ncbi:MAG: ABC transporter permease, partial [Gemmatimonadaceae bacterium]
MATLLQDLRFAFRSLKRHPLFTAIGVLTLALGIGLNTAVFSAIEAMLLRPLSGARAPEEIVQVYRSWPGGMAYGSSSIPHFLDVRDRSQAVFTDVAGWALTPVNLSFGGKNERVFGLIASASYFSTLGVEMYRGRGFSRDEDVGLAAHRVIVLSYSAWERTFGGDPSIVGREAVVNGTGYTVVGITAPSFRGTMPMVTPTLYVPLTQAKDMMPGRGNLFEERNENFLRIVARLKPRVTVAQASGTLATINRQLLESYPKDYKGTGMTIVRQNEAGIHP